MRTLPEKYLSEIPLSKEAYEVDIAVLDRYQSFSAELLRLALLGLAGYGFLIPNVVLKASGTANSFAYRSELVAARYTLAAGAVALAFCAICALGHRYYSTDSIAHHVRRLRVRRRIAELAEGVAERSDLEAIALKEADSLKRDLNKCRWLLLIAAVLLVVGALCVGWSFAVTLSSLPAV